MDLTVLLVIAMPFALIGLIAGGMQLWLRVRGGRNQATAEDIEYSRAIK